jgi:alpha-galactosidase
MSIAFFREAGRFHIKSLDTSYVIQLVKGQFPTCAYWGRRVEVWNDPSARPFVDRAFSPNEDPADRSFSLDWLPQEYPAFGNGDFRSPALQVLQEDGSTITDLRYRSHRIIKGKPRLEGLPSVYAESEEEAETLELTLADEKLGLEALLSYSAYRDFDAIARSVLLRNKGSRRLRLLRVLSASCDFPQSGFEVLHLSGSWARECHIQRARLMQGISSVESRRGASSHQHNPFIALLSPGASEDAGEAWAMSLAYSGNFLAQAEVDQFGSTRLSIGINPFEFTWDLEPGSSFQSPEALLVHSREGLGGMSRKYHSLYRARLYRGRFRDAERPVLINNWESTYFDFDEGKIIGLADEAAALGIELLVLDDGWFGERDDDRSSLGDWLVDRRKLPGGLQALAGEIGRRGLAFGLWIEPEMVSVRSRLYAEHPDWCLHVPDRPRSESRSQLVLDLGRTEVRDFIVETVSSILRSVPIRYVKWDMNRHHTEVGSAAIPPERQKETAHRYILGLYEILERITKAFPEVLFEGCSGGGGRFDPGMLAYMPQAWTSDNTDAASRLLIQYGTSLVYPPIAMGAHVSAAPNHQTGRTTPLAFRGAVAMGGNLGYELDPAKLGKEERSEIARQVAEYKRIRRLVQFGDFYRLMSPFDGDSAAWMFVAPDRGIAYASYYQLRHEANRAFPLLRLKGLEPRARYALAGTALAYGGDELMSAGLAVIGIDGDYQSRTWLLERIGQGSGEEPCAS